MDQKPQRLSDSLQILLEDAKELLAIRTELGRLAKDADKSVKKYCTDLRNVIDRYFEEAAAVQRLYENIVQPKSNVTDDAIKVQASPCVEVLLTGAKALSYQDCSNLRSRLDVLLAERDLDDGVPF